MITQNQFTITKVYDGESLYTWVKYADTATGTGISDSPTNKRFMGIAINKTTATESNTASDYTWSPLYDNVVVGGRNLFLDSEKDRSSTRHLILHTYDILADHIGKEVVVSFDIKAQYARQLQLYPYQNNGISIDTVKLFTPSIDKFTRVTHVAKVKDWGIVNATYTLGSVAIFDNAGLNNYTVKNVKIEKGNIATDWTPAPEDVNKDIGYAEENAKDYTDNNAVIINKPYTNGMLWDDLLGLIVARSDGRLRTVMSGTNGFYIEQKVGVNWVKVFYADINGNVKFAGELEGVSGTFGNITSGNMIGVNMTLGGTDGSNGVLEVLNSSGDLVAELNGDEGGFENLYVGNLSSPSVVSVNTNPINLYVDPINGDDNYSGFDWANAKKTLQGAVDVVPKYNSGIVNINIHSVNGRNMYDQVTFDGITGSGSIIVEGITRANVLTGSVRVTGCSNFIHIKNLTINSTNGMGVEVYRSNYVHCETVTVYGQNSGRCFYADSGSALYLKGCHGWDGSIIIYARTLARIYVENCVGYGTGRGIAAQAGGEIRISGTHPGGAISAEYFDTGGSKVGTGTVNTGGKGVVPIVQQTKLISSTSGDNWSDLYGRWHGDGVRQGNWGYGVRWGCWFFGTGILATIGTGKIIKAVKVHIKRESSSGYSSAVRHSLRLHGHSTRPVGKPSLSNEVGSINLAWGQSGWINVDSAFWAGIANGTYKGFGLYTNGDNYSTCEVQFTVEVTYQ